MNVQMLGFYLEGSIESLNGRDTASYLYLRIVLLKLWSIDKIPSASPRSLLEMQIGGPSQTY